MSKHLRPQTSLAAGAAILLTASAGADGGLWEVPRTMDQLPQSVAQTLQQALGDRQADEIEEIVVEGVPVLYEAEYVQDGEEIEFAIWPNGELLTDAGDDEDDADDDDDEDDEIEDGDDEVGEADAAPDELPPAVQRVLNSIGRDRVDEIEALTYEGITVLYEVELDDDAGLPDDDDDGEADEEGGEFFIHPYGSVVEVEGEELVEREVAMNDVPASIAAALGNLLGDREADEIEEIRYEGTPILYEAEWEADGQEHEVAVLPTGEPADTSEDDETDEELLEEEIDQSDVPTAVVETLMQHLDGPLTEIDRIRYEGVVVLFEAENASREVAVYPDGQLASIRPENGDDDEDDEDDDDEDEDEEDDEE